MPAEPTGTGANNPDTANAADNAGQQLDTQAISRMVNAAVTDQLKRHLPKAIEAAIPGLVDQISTKVAPQPKDDESKGKPSPEMAAMERRLAEMQAKLDKAESDRAAAESKRRDDKAYADLRQHLADNKVRPELVDIYAKVLFHADKRVEYDEQGNALLKLPVSQGNFGEQDQTLPLAEGVKALLKHKSAAPFLPAPGGAPKQGTTPPRAPVQQPGQSPVSTVELSEDQAAARAFEMLQRLNLPIPGDR